LRSSQPSRLESAADVLDAPLNPDDVSHILEITKLVFETGIAALGFLSAAVGLFNTGHSKERLLLKDSRTGKTLGNLSPDTSPDEIRRMLGID
jgi:hypothetical protein